MSNDLTVQSRQSVKGIKDILKGVTEQHKAISKIKTPKVHIQQKPAGNNKTLDFVGHPYMRDIANSEFPGWSWKIIKGEALGSEAYVVHGRLRWFDNGVWRDGDMVAAHRIQQKKDGSGFVDVGNDIKAANTDCMKKAFNVYLNIADDVYKANIKTEEEIERELEEKKLDGFQIERLTVLAKGADKAQTIKNKIANGEIDKNNYEGAIAKLERLGRSTQ